MKRLGSTLGFVLLAAAQLTSRLAHAQTSPTTPGYPERVLQWTVLPGESCADVATALYGNSRYAVLLERYNNVQCARGGDLPDGMTLVVPEKVTEVAPARLESIAPDVREKPPGGAWGPANAGMPLHRNHSVNTLERARADILFVDRSRIVMAAHTLVIIYGTAKDTTQTQKSATVELQEGELQAGLLALRGRSPTVDVQGGGSVTANSRDTVVRSKLNQSQTNRTTVSVFDGSARVRSAGATVNVPEKFGTSFIAARPPTRPRPLPPAPYWTPESDEGVIVAGAAGAVIATSWRAVDKATSYRFEMAKDAEFHQLIAREEVPSQVTAFRAERMPSGNYYLRVRAIDNEDFLGLASTTRKISVVSLAISGAAGQVERGVLTVSPYARLDVKADDGLELAIDEGPFGSVPRAIDLTKRAVTSLNWRQRGLDKVVKYHLKYLPVVAHAVLEAEGTSQRVRVTFENTSEAELVERVKPRLRLYTAHRTSDLELTHDAGQHDWNAALPPDVSALDIVDVRGTTLTSLSGFAAIAVKVPPAAAFEGYATGPCMPLVPSSSDGSVAPWAPTACSSGAAAVTADSTDGVWAERASLRASGMVRSFGFEAMMQSGLSTTRRRGDDALWLGVRWRALTLGRRWSMGPALRVMVPPTADSARLRFESGWAVAGQFRRWSLLGDLGARVASSNDSGAASAPAEQVYLIGGVGYDFSRFLRGFALLDAQLLQHSAAPLHGRAGLGFAVETRGAIYAGWALRLSPWQDSGGNLAVQASLGLRP